jgi:hypothetical protein
MAALPDPPDPNDSAITPWNVRETILNTGVHAANDLREWQRALDLNAEALESQRRRGAADTDQARTAFNNYGPLLRLGRAGEARDLLRRCRGIFEATNDIPALGKTLSALADTENELSHLDRAIDLAKDALRFKYLAADPDAIMTSHHNLASYLDRDGADRQQVWAHLLAAAVIAYQTGSGQLTPVIRGLAGLLAAHGPSAAPRSFPRVREIVDQVEGVHLAGLLNRLPRRAPDNRCPTISGGPAPALRFPARRPMTIHNHTPTLSPSHPKPLKQTPRNPPAHNPAAGFTTRPPIGERGRRKSGPSGCRSTRLGP